MSQAPAHNPQSPRTHDIPSSRRAVLVVTAPYWNRPAGSTLPPDHKVSLYATSVTLTPGRQIAYVTLPNNARLHIFATSLS